MTVYYVVLGLSLLLLLPSIDEHGSIATRGKIATIERKPGVKIGFFIFSVMLIFVAGFRYHVGTDYSAYYLGYTRYAAQLWVTVKTLDEPVISLIDRVGLFFVKNEIGGILFPACVTLFLILRTTYKYSSDVFFSGMLLLFTCWSSCFNGVRQALAAAVLYCGYPYLRDKKLLQYGIVVFLAYLCHKSAIIMICVYFVCRNKISAKNVIFLVFGSLVILFNYDRLFGFLNTILDKNYAYETNTYISTAINPLRVVIHCAPAGYYLVKYWDRRKTELQTMWLNFLIIRAVMMIAASGSTMLGRIGMYTSTMCLIAIPELNRGLDKGTKTIMKWIILALYCFVWIYEIAGSSSMNTFQFVWQR